MQVVHVYEDNAGFVYLRTDMGAWDMSALVDCQDGRQDMIAASHGDTDDWTVPTVEHTEDDWDSMELIAWVDNPLTVSYYPHRMGTAGKTYFGVGDTDE